MGNEIVFTAVAAPTPTQAPLDVTGRVSSANVEFSAFVEEIVSGETGDTLSDPLPKVETLTEGIQPKTVEAAASTNVDTWKVEAIRKAPLTDTRSFVEVLPREAGGRSQPQAVAPQWDDTDNRSSTERALAPKLPEPTSLTPAVALPSQRYLLTTPLPEPPLPAAESVVAPAPPAPVPPKTDTIAPQEAVARFLTGPDAGVASETAKPIVPVADPPPSRLQVSATVSEMPMSQTTLRVSPEGPSFDIPRSSNKPERGQLQVPPSVGDFRPSQDAGIDTEPSDPALAERPRRDDRAKTAGRPALPEGPGLGFKARPLDAAPRSVNNEAFAKMAAPPAAVAPRPIPSAENSAAPEMTPGPTLPAQAVPQDGRPKPSRAAWQREAADPTTQTPPENPRRKPERIPAPRSEPLPFSPGVGSSQRAVDPLPIAALPQPLGEGTSSPTPSGSADFTVLPSDESLPNRTETQRFADQSLPRAESPRPVQAQIVDVARQLNDGSVELRLSPEELGRVKLTVSHAEGDLAITVLVERSETLDLLRRSSDALTADLRQAGFERLSLNFGQSDARSSPERSANPPEDAAPPAEPSDPVPASAPDTVRRPDDGTLDIRL